MKHSIVLITALLISAMLFASCAPKSKTPAPRAVVEDMNGLSETLRAAGANVEMGDSVEQTFFTVMGQIIKVNGVDVQVFEYESAEALDVEAALVAPDGGSVGTSMMMWMATPHFFKSGRVLVLYIGDDDATLDLLRDALGEQFAGR